MKLLVFQLNSEKYFPKFKFEIQSEEYTIQQFKHLDCLEIGTYCYIVYLIRNCEEISIANHHFS